MAKQRTDLIYERGIKRHFFVKTAQSLATKMLFRPNSFILSIVEKRQQIPESQVTPAGR
jgi:hypothetical protein